MAERPVPLAVISTSRSDFALLAPIVAAARNDPRFTVRLAVCGAHHLTNTPSPAELAALNGLRLPRPQDSLGLVHQLALRDWLNCSRVALVLGDRSELLETALAVLHAGVALAHVSGGERTAGAWDDQVRDAITRLAHLHLPAHQPAGQRLLAMGEEPWRICVTGEPGLDGISEDLWSASSLGDRLGVIPTRNDVVVAIHPVTRQPAETGQMLALIASMAENQRERRWFLSTPNGDPGSEIIRAAWAELATRLPNCTGLADHGAAIFRSLVANCGLLIGNSSAGLVEAPSLGTPTIDLGSRQSGRLRGASVVSCPQVDATHLATAFADAQRVETRACATPAHNPYGDGHAVPRILDHLWRHAERPDLLVKA